MLPCQNLSAPVLHTGDNSLDPRIASMAPALAVFAFARVIPSGCEEDLCNRTLACHALSQYTRFRF